MAFRSVLKYLLPSSSDVYFSLNSNKTIVIAKISCLSSQLTPLAANVCAAGSPDQRTWYSRPALVLEHNSSHFPFEDLVHLDVEQPEYTTQRGLLTGHQSYARSSPGDNTDIVFY